MDGGGGYGVGNEAISAVTDEGFVVEEDDEDYEDLYSDVNVGEGFLQAVKSNDVSVQVEEVERKIDVAQQFPALVETRVSEVGSAGNGGGSVVAESGTDVLENQGMGGAGMTGVVGGGIKVELEHVDRKVSGLGEENFGQVGGSVQHLIQQPQGGGVGGGQEPFKHQISFQHQQPHNGADIRNMGNDGYGRGGNMMVSDIGGNGVNNVGGSNGVHVAAGGVGGNTGGGGGTMLFVGDLQWWTTDSDLELELCNYGAVKEVKFFDEKASGKSKGYCQVEFYDSAAASACKDGMNGHVFNGRACVVAFASPFSVKRMGEAQVSRTQQTGQGVLNQPKRAPNETAGKPVGNNIDAGGNYHGGGDNSRGGYGGRGNWSRGNSQGMGNRGGGPGGMRRGGRGIMGNGGNAFNQGMGGNPQMMHPQAMMGQGFDPAYGGPMGRMGYGFPGGPVGPFPGMMQPFPPFGGMPGVAPHVNPAFFGRGMPMNSMGMVPTPGMEGQNMGMWQDPNMAEWGAEDHPGRTKESSYGDEVASDPHYDEANLDRTEWQGKEKDRGSERERSVSSDKKYREGKETGFDGDVPRHRDNVSDRSYADNSGQRDERDINRSREREFSRERDRLREKDKKRDRENEREMERYPDRYRDDRSKYGDHHRHRDHESERDVDLERGSSLRAQHQSRYDDDRRPRSREADYEDDRRPRSREADYGKKRRLAE